MTCVLVLSMLAGLMTAWAACPAGTIQGLSAESCYLVTKETLAWGNAEQRCVSKGGHLISVANDITNTFVQSAASLLWTNVYWIGGYYNVIQSNWVWTDGTRWSYKKWANGQPNSSDNYCILFNGTSGEWYASACGSVQPYLCKVPPVGGLSTPPPLPPSLQPPVTPPVCPAGYFTIHSSYLCYTVVQNLVEWQTALTGCNDDNAQLASIKSAAVQQELQAQVWNPCSGTGCWIGLHLNEGTKDFQWTDGSAVEYTNWDDNQPGSTPGYYVYLSTPTDDGAWVAINEGHPLYYICEKAPYHIGA
jgi:hypothetical protein